DRHQGSWLTPLILLIADQVQGAGQVPTERVRPRKYAASVAVFRPPMRWIPEAASGGQGRGLPALRVTALSSGRRFPVRRLRSTRTADKNDVVRPTTLHIAFGGLNPVGRRDARATLSGRLRQNAGVRREAARARGTVPARLRAAAPPRDPARRHGRRIPVADTAAPGAWRPCCCSCP